MCLIRKGPGSRDHSYNVVPKILLDFLLTTNTLILSYIIFDRPLQIDSEFSINRIYSLLIV